MSGSGQPPNGVSRPSRPPGHWVLSPIGDLDVCSRDAVDRELRDHIDAVAASVIIVDLSAVTFMDSAGLETS